MALLSLLCAGRRAGAGDLGARAGAAAGLGPDGARCERAVRGAGQRRRPRPRHHAAGGHPQHRAGEPAAECLCGVQIFLSHFLL